MNILIIGEFSGFAYNLALGWESLGHNVIEFGSLDGSKNIPQIKQSFLYHNNISPLGKTKAFWHLREIANFLKFKRDIKQFYHFFDTIFIINYTFLRLKYDFLHPKFSIDDVKYVAKPNAKIFLSSCGADLPVLEFAHTLRYSPYSSDYLKICYGWRYKRILKQTLELIDGVIPAMYEYAEAYRQFSKIAPVKVCSTIPLPLDCSKYKFCNDFSDKIVVFHGKSRPMKGGDYIIPAMEKLKNNYPNKVQIVIQGGMPFNEYVKVLSKANIIIDQCQGYSYGMNAIISMAMGKIVLSGNEPECENEFKRKVPIINILPDMEDIYNKLEKLVNTNIKELINLSKSSYEFARAFHDTNKVSQRYLELF